jgi:hypothetical protein
MTARRLITAGLLALVAVGVVIQPAIAHTRSQSFSSWHLQDEQVQLSFSVQSLEATRLGLEDDLTLDLNELLVKHLSTRISVSAGGTACRTISGPEARPATAGYLRVEWGFACPNGKFLEITNDAFFTLAPSHVHYARVRSRDGRLVEYLFTNSERRHQITVNGQKETQPLGASFVAYVQLGVEHILVGADHLAFLLALLLFCRRAREVALTVTGFTVGHSITLSLAVLGIVTPNVSVIEALIGFTIALVAAENIGVTTGTSKPIARSAGMLLALFALLKGFVPVHLPVLSVLGLALFSFCYLSLADTQERTARLRPALTVLFGLVHGFGFAGVLLEMRLPTSRLVSALFGFNLGVELGQLAIVAVLWLMGRQLGRRFFAEDSRFATDTASAALCAVGLFWFVGRAFQG